MKKVALFDLDHTLIPMDSDFQWGEFTLALGWCDSTEFKLRNTEFYKHYQAGTLDIHAYVRFATQAMREQGATKSIAAHAHFMREIVQKGIKEPALKLIRQHQAAGDEVVIVTATNEFVTRPIAAVFGVRELIAVELEYDVGGKLTMPLPWHETWAFLKAEGHFYLNSEDRESLEATGGDKNEIVIGIGFEYRAE